MEGLGGSRFSDAEGLAPASEVNVYGVTRGRWSVFLTRCNSSLDLVQKDLVTLRQSDKDRRRASIKTVHDVSDEVFRGANNAPLKMTRYCAV
jgi:hypothetical protein